MSSEYARKSAANMRAAQRDMLSKAEAVQPTVAVMESNWNAMIASQKMQVDTLGDIMEKLDTLTTTAELRDFMGQQIWILQQHAEKTVQTMEEYQKKMMHAADGLEKECQLAVKNLEKQAGSVSEKFSQAISEQSVLMKKLTKRCFWIAMIPSLLLLLLELMPYIWRLIFGS